jgi:hypothetical protein
MDASFSTEIDFAPCCPIAPFDPGVDAHFALPSTSKTIWGAGSSFGQERNLHWLQELDLSDDTVTSIELAKSPRIWTQAKLMQNDG